MDVTALITERSRLIALLASIPVAGSVSEGGRNFSFSRTDIQAQIDALTVTIQQLQGPFVIHSTGRAGY